MTAAYEISGILVSGPDAQKFLQGQLTCDINLLTADHPLRGAHCNQKGRVEALYDIFLTPAGILLVTKTDVIQHALDKLQFYARFSKVQLAIVPVEFKVELPMPRLHPQTLGKYLPQELGLDQTEAVSFTKGCYIGQEIVARLHYLGKLKRELIQIESEDSLLPGEAIEHPTLGTIEVIDKLQNKALVLK